MISMHICQSWKTSDACFSGASRAVFEQDNAKEFDSPPFPFYYYCRQAKASTIGRKTTLEWTSPKQVNRPEGSLKLVWTPEQIFGAVKQGDALQGKIIRLPTAATQFRLHTVWYRGFAKSVKFIQM